MKLAMTTATVLVATTLVEGVNLRSRSGAQVRALSAAHIMTMNRLATKYDCHDATGDLVTTIHNVVAANDQEGTRLQGECDAMITKHRADWTTATDLYNTEFDKIVPEETATETTKKGVANTQFSSVENQWCTEGFVMDGYAGCGTTLGASVLPPKKAKDTADSEATDAIAAYDAAFKLHDEEETQSIADRKAMSNKIDGEKTTAKTIMDDAFTTAEGERAAGISAAETTQTEQKAECQRLFDERSAHISSDTNLLSKLKPLLEQLNICKNSKHKMLGGEAPPPKRKWYKGADGSTCDQTCAKVSQEVGVSLVCNSAEQTALNSQAKVGAAFAEAGYECKGYHAARDYQGTPFSTGRNDDCAPFIHDSNLKSTCDSNSHDHHAPLCACTVAGSSFLEVSTEARCAAVRSETMSLLEMDGDPMGSYHDFEDRVKSETAHMNAQKKSCDDDTTSNFETTKNEYLTNEQKSKDDTQNAYDSLVETVNKQLAKFIEDETAHVKTLFDGMKAKEGTKNSKVEVQATKDAEFKAKVTEGKAAMSVAVIDKIDAMESAKTTKEAKIATRKADLITGNQNKKREIDTLSAHDKEYCDDAKNNLVTESNIIKQMLDVLNTGGDGGSGLRVVKDEVDGNMHSALDEAGTIDANADSMTQNDDFSSEALTSITKINFCAKKPCQNGGECVDGEEDFTCNCADGFGGKTCEINQDCTRENPNWHSNNEPNNGGAPKNRVSCSNGGCNSQYLAWVGNKYMSETIQHTLTNGDIILGNMEGSGGPTLGSGNMIFDTKTEPTWGCREGRTDMCSAGAWVDCRTRDNCAGRRMVYSTPNRKVSTKKFALSCGKDITFLRNMLRNDL